MKKKDNWIIITGDYELTNKGGFLGPSASIPLVIIYSENTGELKLFSKKIIDNIGIQKAFDLSESTIRKGKQ